MLLASVRMSQARGQSGCATGCARAGVCDTGGAGRGKGRDILNAELITLVVGFLTLAGGQITAVLVLVGRMDRHADQVTQRFDRVNKRFDEVNAGVNERFDGVNKRFDEVNAGVNERFDGVNAGVNERFDGANQRLDGVNAGVNKRFDGVNEGVNQRFDDLNEGVNKRFDDVSREFGDLRERMARLEGALDGFVAGRRDRGIA